MKSPTMKSLVGTLLLIAVLAGCSPSPETIGDMARTSIQEIFRVDPRFEGSGIEVLKVQLTSEGEQKYKGIASIRYKGEVHDVPVNVLVDGLSIKWSTAEDAFSFIAPNKPPQ